MSRIENNGASINLKTLREIVEIGLECTIKLNWIMKAIDVFSGLGGMSLGAVMAGIKPILAIEKDIIASKTYISNHPETNLICTDVREISFKKNKIDPPFVFFGGPPCQGFSLSNTKTRNINLRFNK